MTSHDELRAAEMSVCPQEETSGLLGRHAALGLFLQLQRQGYLPYMQEEAEGQYRVYHRKSPT